MQDPKVKVGSSGFVAWIVEFLALGWTETAAVPSVSGYPAKPDPYSSHTSLHRCRDSILYSSVLQLGVPEDASWRWKR